MRKTVNFDEPSILHFYCGDASGSPRSLISFFVHEGATRGQRGVGHVSAIVLAVAKGSLPKWRRHLKKSGAQIEGTAWAFGSEYLCFNDPDGLELALCEERNSRYGATDNGRDRESEYRIKGIQSIEMQIEGFQFTSNFLHKLGFTQTGHEGSLFRFQQGSHECPVIVDLLCTPDHRPGSPGPGLINHIALLVSDANALTSIASDIAAFGYDVTPPLDRQYFSAVYFRGPNGAKFAVATFGPGFPPVDNIDQMADILSLPSWLEPQRAKIEQRFRKLSARVSRDPATH